ncbi:hypothetical protein EJB05_08960, partial [Eragrostis curvula]
MDRLKLICEDILCNHVDDNSVSTMLVLTDQLNCRNLKDACIKYMVNSVASSNSLKPKRSFVALVLDKWKDASFRYWKKSRPWPPRGYSFELNRSEEAHHGLGEITLSWSLRASLMMTWRVNVASTFGDALRIVLTARHVSVLLNLND